MKSYFLFALLFISCNNLFSENIQNSYLNPEIKFFTLRDGLSQVSVNDICKDKMGFLWLGTQNGLNRYDGSSFKIYKNDPSKKGTICDNFINVLFEDSRGYIWVGTENGGVCYLDTKTDLFIHPELKKNDSRLTVSAITEDPYGRIIVAFDKLGVGIFSFEKLNLTEVNLLSDSNSVQISSLFVSEDSVLWAGTRNGILYSSSLKLNSEINFRKRAVEDDVFLTKITESSNHDIYVGTRSGLFIFDSSQSNLHPLQIKDGITVGNFNPLLIYDIHFDPEKRFWIATGNGLYETRIDSSNARSLLVSNYYKANKNNGGIISNNTVFCVKPDPENGLVWIGTGKYLNLLVEKKPFYNLQSVIGDQQTLSSSVVFSVLKTNDKLWIGTSDGGLNMIEKGVFHHFYETQLGLPNNPIFSLAEDHLHNLWVGAKSGVTVVSKNELKSNNFHFTAITHTSENPESLSDNFARKVFIDSKNNIWICTQLGGLNRFTGNLKSGRYTFQKFRYTGENDSCIASDKIYCITEDRLGNYWIGTNAGLNKLSFKTSDYSDPEFTSWSHRPDIANGLSSNSVYSIAIDKDGMIWLGTRNGLNMFNPINESFKVLNSESGLPDNVIYSVLEDKNRNIWVSTNNGISRLDKTSMQFVNYNEQDGLLAREFNINAHYMDENGMLYFGCINGLNIFNPDSLNNVDKTQQLIFTEFEYNEVNNGEISILKPAKVSGNLKLSYKNFPFQIKFTDVDIRPFKDISFAYRLLPKNNTWNNIGQNRVIQFPKLAPGKYKIEIQGITRGKTWKTKPLVLELTVTPPWWWSKLAIIIYALVFLSVIYVIYLKRLQSILAKRETLRLKELGEFKNKFFTDITHEFRTPLTVIMGLSRNVKTKLSKTNPGISENLTTIERNGEILLQLVNQMLDLVRLDQSGMVLKQIHADVIPYLQYIFECFDSAAKIKNIHIWFYNECSSSSMDFDPEQLHKIVSNLLSNALKHTPENGKILMHVNNNSELNQLIIKVQNSGEGIPENEMPYIFDRFYTNKKDDYNSGIGVGLSLAQELANLMGGDIQVKNLPENGVVFTVTLPITKLAPTNKETNTPHVFVPAINQKITHKTLQKNTNDTRLLVMIIEDNKDVSDYIQMCLSETYRVHCCYDGQTGIEDAFSLIPDLIISDIMMPRMSGTEVCSAIKNDRRTCHIPVILLTALSENSDKIKGFTAGADAYLGKPFDETELLVRIEKMIELRQNIQKKYSYLPEQIQSHSLDDDFITETIQYIKNHLSNIQFKTSDLAFELKLSESQLYRKIKALSGKSTALFIRYIRLQEAKKLLTNTDQNISEIAYFCGFNDPAWFSRSFKEEFGYSPKEFRGNNKFYQS